MTSRTAQFQQRAVFLDRDGTINVEVNYLHRAADCRLIARSAEAIQLLNAAGYVVIVVTNQAGVARGYYAAAAVHALHDHMARMLAAAHAYVDAFYMCTHHPDFTGTCACRKPQPGMLRRAAREWNIDLRQSWLIGDTRSDLEAGLAAGCRPVLVRTGYGADTEARLHHAPLPFTVPIVDDLYAAVQQLLHANEHRT